MLRLGGERSSAETNWRPDGSQTHQAGFRTLIQGSVSQDPPVIVDRRLPPAQRLENVGTSSVMVDLVRSERDRLIDIGKTGGRSPHLVMGPGAVVIGLVVVGS